MLCKQCGGELQQNFLYCPKCGQKIEKTNEIPDRPQKYSPLWFRFFIALVLVVGVFALMFELSSEDLTDTVEKQLKAIRQDQMTEAYYHFTAKSFQEATSLEHFKDFIKNYSFFSHNRSVRFIDRNVNNDQGSLEAVLTPADGKDVQVQYRLIKEDGRWKVLSIRLEDRLTKTLPKS